MKVLYIVGRYPELTTTFIEREIEVLRRLGNGDIHVQALSIRYPLTPADISPHHQKVREQTIYLVPDSWARFDVSAFIWGNLRFALLRPRAYFGILLYLLTHAHPDLNSRLKTALHFSLAAYAAHLLRRQDFDHIHAHFIDRAVVVAMVIGRLLDKPYSLTAHANNIFVEKILIREKIANARFAVTVSQYNKAYLLEHYPGLDPDKIHILHPWVDVSRFTPPPSRPAHQRLRILSIGRLVEKKGHGDLVRACYHLQQRGLDFECRIVGRGPLKSRLADQIAQSGLQDRVQLMGGQPQTEVMRLLASWADVFALPCVIARDGDRDGIPVSLAEAMAMELPIVSTDLVGIGELVQPSAGRLVQPRDADALADALESIHAAAPAARAEMGRQGRAIVEAKFNLIEGTAQLSRLFQESR